VSSRHQGALSGTGTARIWEAATGKEIMTLRGHEGDVRDAGFSPDGTRIVTASGDDLMRGKKDYTVRIWNTATGEQLMILRGHDQELNSAAFSPDGTRVVTASSDNTARIWDAATGKEIAVLVHSNQLRFVAFSPDGARIVTVEAMDGTAHIWDVHTAMMSAKSLVDEVCLGRMRGLTTLTRGEMRLAGYPDSTPEIDVCAGLK
jgi:WD40 repeat protein